MAWLHEIIKIAIPIAAFLLFVGIGSLASNTIKNTEDKTW